MGTGTDPVSQTWSPARLIQSCLSQQQHLVSEAGGCLCMFHKRCFGDSGSSGDEEASYRTCSSLVTQGLVHRPSKQEAWV